MHGASLSGKSTVCKILNQKLGYRVVDWKVIEDNLKKSMGTEAEPFEGEVDQSSLDWAFIGYISNLSENRG